ncbi:MAG TPA: hypothetical protein P5144_15240, partial [Thermoanaerobaculia bacterium]|nr:hypothetical protein [Thermoanaerobaculia bacterium]
MPGLISEVDIQRACERLRTVLPEAFPRQYFGRERMDRLERIVGTKLTTHFLLDLLVRQQGPSLLAERPRRIGAQQTSVRRLLLESLDEEALRSLFKRVRGREAPANRRTIERDLAELNWHRGSMTALRVTRALGLPDAFAGVKERNGRTSVYEIEPIGALPPLKAFQRGILREVRLLLERRTRVMVSSFTGTGKTRIGMEYVVDQLLAEEQQPLVIWVAQKG